MKYLALADGTIGKGSSVHRVRKGTVFTLPEGQKPGRWMTALETPVKPEKKVEPKKPVKKVEVEVDEADLI